MSAQPTHAFVDTAALTGFLAQHNIPSPLKCIVCQDEITDTTKDEQTLLMKCCNAAYHASCFKQMCDNSECDRRFGFRCVACKHIFGTYVSTAQPKDGIMHIDCGHTFFKITYTFPYMDLDFRRICYIPREELPLLIAFVTAFNRGHLFRIGTSQTTGKQNTIIWSSIPQKTSEHGGPAMHGYPDPDYVRRVTDQLKQVGVPVHPTGTLADDQALDVPKHLHHISLQYTPWVIKQDCTTTKSRFKQWPYFYELEGWDKTRDDMQSFSFPYIFETARLWRNRYSNLADFYQNPVIRNLKQMLGLSITNLLQRHKHHKDADLFRHVYDPIWHPTVEKYVEWCKTHYECLLGASGAGHDIVGFLGDRRLELTALIHPDKSGVVFQTSSDVIHHFTKTSSAIPTTPPRKRVRMNNNYDFRTPVIGWDIILIPVSVMPQVLDHIGVRTIKKLTAHLGQKVSASRQTLVDNMMDLIKKGGMHHVECPRDIFETIRAGRMRLHFSELIWNAMDVQSGVSYPDNSINHTWLKWKKQNNPTVVSTPLKSTTTAVPPSATTAAANPMQQLQAIFPHIPLDELKHIHQLNGNNTNYAISFLLRNNEVKQPKKSNAQYNTRLLRHDASGNVFRIHEIPAALTELENCYDELNTMIHHFHRVESLFHRMSTIPNGSGQFSHLTVHRVDYIDNPWLKADNKEWRMLNQFDNNVYLWHGTDSMHNNHSIASNNFDLVRSKRALYGKGIYFSGEPLTCLHYAHRQQMVLILSRVTLGNVHKVTKEEMQDKEHEMPERFSEDTHCHYVPGMGHYVIFEPAQIVPMYLVHLKSRH